MICARPTLLTLAWASGRVLMSHPVPYHVKKFVKSSAKAMHFISLFSTTMPFIS